MANAERIFDVLKFLEDNPDKHRQEDWLKKTNCGTVGCMAGWACLRNGYVEKFVGNEYGGWSFHGVYRDGDPDQVLSEPINVAVDVLDLARNQAWAFFDANLSLDALWERADKMTDGEVGRLRSRAEVVT